jgi:hypothetical protein
MTDLVERLRDWDRLTVADAMRAADEIELLRAQHELALQVHNKMADEIERLRAALAGYERFPTQQEIDDAAQGLADYVKEQDK